MIIIRTHFLSFQTDDKPAVVLEDIEESDDCKFVGVLSGKSSIDSIFSFKII